MEVGAVAQAAMRLGKPWAAIKAVTDTADEGSSRDFHANLVRAARSAAQAVERLVAMPGFGNFVAPQQQIRQARRRSAAQRRHTPIKVFQMSLRNFPIFENGYEPGRERVYHDV